jgi:hypothetical protein
MKFNAELVGNSKCYYRNISTMKPMAWRLDLCPNGFIDKEKFIYFKDANDEWMASPPPEDYAKELPENIGSFDPLLYFIPTTYEMIHPIAKFTCEKGDMIRAVDTYHILNYKGEDTTLEKLVEMGILNEYLDTVLIRLQYEHQKHINDSVSDLQQGVWGRRVNRKK